MNKYELAVAVNGKLEESDKGAVVDKVKALIERFGGSITSVDDWGKKRYAYEVEKKDGISSLNSRQNPRLLLRSSSVSASWTTSTDISSFRMKKSLS